MGKIVVLGAAGTIGRVIVKDLVEDGVDVVAADLDLGKLEELKAWVGKPIETASLNIKDHEQTVEVLKQGKVCINAVNYIFNVDIMKAAAAAGVSVLDLGGLYTVTKEQLKLDSFMKEANVLSVVGMGSDPGASNIFSRYGVEQLDEAEEIHIRFGSTTSGVTFPFAVDTILDEATKTAYAVKDGQVCEIEPLGDEEYTVFHKEIGIQQTFTIIHSELATLPTSYPQVKQITYKDTWDPATIEKIRFFDSLGMLDSETSGASPSPRRQLVSLLQQTMKDKPEWGIDELMVEVIGTKDGNRVALKMELLTDWHREWNVSATQYATAIPASIVAQMLMRGEIEETGVKPPEQCIDPEKFMAYLANKNVELYITSSETKNY
jgi:lysine 6-dehydrogenase